VVVAGGGVSEGGGGSACEWSVRGGVWGFGSSVVPRRKRGRPGGKGESGSGW
jgi:hypothetical protein